ncbi:helix-turn-helix domain-containing protein [Stutzerimonas marianensis]|uniref:helix-turn-helix domain-containing protein n=1 Tax=Stutzerimonas marianensis TaxID=2929513 RepID=UPI003C2FBF5C
MFCLFYVARRFGPAQPWADATVSAMRMIEPTKPLRMTPRRRARQASYEALISRVLELLPGGCARPPRLRELCRAVGVSERTLRSAFIATLGMAPARYLRLRRLHLLRAALAIADRHHASVAVISARFGYTDQGRMAAQYHALFGEYPSETLERGLAGPGRMGAVRRSD